ncbi:hypothetical protein [Chryseobacterium mucoviscidosis]|uniref:hypothetical protein n=1 Tax=Chryseobacterium TaxID=59732 RepID=UPI0031DF7B09
MAKTKKTNLLELQKTRTFTISLEPIAGTINLFYAFINGIRVIADDASQKRTWSGVIPDSEIRLKIRVSGMGNARFRMEIDLPGTADDQSVIFNLTNGYYETKIYL